MLPGLNDYLDLPERVCLALGLLSHPLSSNSASPFLPHCLLHLFPTDWPQAESIPAQFSLSPCVVITQTAWPVPCRVLISRAAAQPVASELCKMIYCPAILRQKYLRKLVTTVDSVSVLVVFHVVFAQFISPQIVVQLRLQLCVCNRMRPGKTPPQQQHT